ncbi:MAG: hypothetical protein KKE37_04520 [Verrucomicrobia bacterium]|nr:hypothetical protein [Verrucomicrobiota bacterium]MBU4291755.1 hypothetical protein [Verrucomicrobiota bacterium]MBU4428601.1 hypothetical protein [Verrucomicrobiota bacterium]MCG2679345.1 hypothetical protein [Kiritimatiellia bacterium]
MNEKLVATVCAVTAVAGGMGRVNARRVRSGVPTGLSMAAVASICVLNFCQGMVGEAKGGIALTKGATPEIAISGQVATSSDIAAAIKDMAVFKKDGDTITLLANLLIKNDAGLKIVQEKWILGDRCVIGVAGTLMIDKSEMTSVNHVLGRRGKIQAGQSQSGWVFRSR